MKERYKNNGLWEWSREIEIRAGEESDESHELRG
jgi:hypothetical protein